MSWNFAKVRPDPRRHEPVNNPRRDIGQPGAQPIIARLKIVGQFHQTGIHLPETAVFTAKFRAFLDQKVEGRVGKIGHAIPAKRVAARALIWTPRVKGAGKIPAPLVIIGIVNHNRRLHKTGQKSSIRTDRSFHLIEDFRASKRADLAGKQVV